MTSYYQLLNTINSYTKLLQSLVIDGYKLASSKQAKDYGSQSSESKGEKLIGSCHIGWHLKSSTNFTLTYGGNHGDR